jgi:hypothetical protein
LTASQSATPAPVADDCLTAPKNETPVGSHWYYRIEHPSNRHCWYLREEGDAHAQTAPSSASASAQPVAPKPDRAMPGSVANARAELTAKAPFDQDSSPSTGQVPAAARTTIIDNAPPAPAADTNMSASVVASRWPEQLSANAAAAPSPPPAPANPPAEVQADASLPPQQQPAVAPPAVVPLATADASMTKQSGSFVMLLAVTVGGLSVAGLIASMLFGFGRKRRRSHQDIPQDARPVWDIDRDLRRRAPLPFPAAAVHRQNIGAPLELQEAQEAYEVDDRDRIAQMLERLARSAQR